jgi:hypothetical protein
MFDRLHPNPKHLETEGPMLKQEFFCFTLISPVSLGRELIPSLFDCPHNLVAQLVGRPAKPAHFSGHLPTVT